MYVYHKRNLAQGKWEPKNSVLWGRVLEYFGLVLILFFLDVLLEKGNGRLVFGCFAVLCFPEVMKQDFSIRLFFIFLGG